jgi:hypothetical protein
MVGAEPETWPCGIVPHSYRKMKSV